MPVNILYRALFVADTFAHEMGHTIFFWLFGQPAIPMIFTLFGSDQAGGFSQTFGHFWLVQIAVFVGLIYGCYWVYENYEEFFIPAVIFTILIMIIAFSGYYDVVTLYMGHGGSILIGGFLLYRAWLKVRGRSDLERFLSALFGFYLVLDNFYFSYSLIFNSYERYKYSTHQAFGAIHNDFLAITDIVYSWSVQGIACFTIGLCITTLIVSLIFAIVKPEDEYEEMDLEAA